MHLFLLGGNSQKNWEWIRNVSEELDSLFSDSTMQYYGWWGEDRDFEETDIALESEKLSRLIANTNDDDYAIFAKGTGAIIAITSIKEHQLKPTACFFFGLAVKETEGSSAPLKTLLMNWNIPTLFAQNSDDPKGPMKTLRPVIANCNAINFETAEYPGSTHKYIRFELIKEDIGRFLGKLN